MATRIQVRRDTEANWAAAPTTVLASGEIGFESDTLQFKIGDGVAQWQNLEYAGGTTPIIKNTGGTTITDLNDASLRNNGNGKYLFAGADPSLANEPSGLSTATDGQLMVTVAKYDYTGQTSSGAERFLMTLTTMTTGKTYYRTYNGGWSSWYPVITGDSSGNATVPGDLAVNGGDITTTSTGTATVFNTNATTLNVGEAATTVSIGATTGTATIRNATTAITGNATVGGSATVGTTLGVTGNTTLTGDLAVNGGDITTSAATATVFNTTATTVRVAGAATTTCIADSVTASQTVDIATGATASGATKTINIGTGGAAGSTTNINIGDADGGSVNIARDLAVDTNVLKVDATNNRVGINVTSPTQALDVVGNLLVSGSATINSIALANMSGETKTNYLHFNTATSGTSQVGSIAIISVTSGDGFIDLVSSSARAFGGGVTGQTSGNTTVIGVGGGAAATAIVAGGVSWSVASSGSARYLRPSAGVWSYAFFGAAEASSSTAEWSTIVIAVRTA